MSLKRLCCKAERVARVGATMYARISTVIVTKSVKKQTLDFRIFAALCFCANRMSGIRNTSPITRRIEAVKWIANNVINQETSSFPWSGVSDHYRTSSDRRRTLDDTRVCFHFASLIFVS